MSYDKLFDFNNDGEVDALEFLIGTEQPKVADDYDDLKYNYSVIQNIREENVNK